MDTSVNVSHFEAVMADLQNKREYHAKAIADIEILIAGIQRHLGVTDDRPATVLSTHAPTQIIGPFTDLSLRRAIRVILSLANAPIKTGEITAKLLKGGFRSAARSFSGNVSATLSEDKKQSFTEVHELGWILTEKGKQEQEEWTRSQSPELIRELAKAA